MRLFNRNQPNLSAFHRGRSRAGHLSKGELMDWIDVAGTELAKNASSYRRNPDPFTAGVLRDNAMVLAGLCEEFHSRHTRKV